MTDPRPAGRTPSRRAGFTLIEVVLAVGVIIIVMGFSMPTFVSMFKNRRLENAGTLISSTLNEVRNNAVTTKQEHTVVFLRNGLRVYREPKRTDPGGFVGTIRVYDPDRVNLQYDLHFAARPFDEVPEELAALEANSSLPPEEWTITPEDIVLRFRPDGTVDFGKFSDIPSYEYRAEPAQRADIVVREFDDQQRLFLDIRPTGRTEFKVEEVLE